MLCAIKLEHNFSSVFRKLAQTSHLEHKESWSDKLRHKSLPHLFSFLHLGELFPMQFNLFEIYLNIKLQLSAAFNWLHSRVECCFGSYKYWASREGECRKYQLLRDNLDIEHQINVLPDKWSPIRIWLFFNLIWFIELEWTRRDRKGAKHVIVGGKALESIYNSMSWESFWDVSLINSNSFIH